MSFPINLGTATPYAIIANFGGIIFGSNTLVSGGNVGHGPLPGTITGLVPGPPSPPGTLVPPSVVDNSAMATVQLDVTNAINQAILIPVTNNFIGPTFDLNIAVGLTIPPGVYKFSNILNIPVSVTLSGGSSDYYLFISGNLTISASINIGNVDPQKVTFIAFSNITMSGASNIVNGTFIAPGAITTPANTTVNGRLISQDSKVTLGDGTNVNPAPPVPPICFVKGTKIMTNRGFVPIEDITLNDSVVTTGIINNSKVSPIGLMKTPIVFIGNFSEYHLTNISRPIVISKNALGANVPTEDVRVSPDHAIVINKITVYAKYLVNGVTIYRDMECNSVVYYHIMTQNHFTLNSSGLWSESLKGCAERFTSQLTNKHGKRNNAITKKFR